MVGKTSAEEPFSPNLLLTPGSRRPIRLPRATIREVEAYGFAMAPPRRDDRFKQASLVIVTYNNLVFTRLCLAALLVHTTYPNYEIIVVDNASGDRTVGFLRELARQQPHVRVIVNASNRGFAAAINQGVRAATGEVLVLLNNDTIVSPGWLTRLVRYLDDPSIGAVGPVTNRCGNEAEVDASYHTYRAFMAFAQDAMNQRAGACFDIPMLTMFCLALRRDTYEKVGPVDERFGIGMFEDDDYALRLHAAGYRTVCAEDVFVHHFGEASFGELASRGGYGTLFHANRQRFEEKWGQPWQPHAHRRSLPYRRTIARIQDLVRRTLPVDATIAVVSKGDKELLKLDGRKGWHFPQAEDGGYAGCYPATSAEAIDQLETIRARGAAYLLVPGTAFWWLDYYKGFRTHLEKKYRVCVQDEDTCMIIALDQDVIEPRRSEAV